MEKYIKHLLIYKHFITLESERLSQMEDKLNHGLSHHLVPILQLVDH